MTVVTVRYFLLGDTTLRDVVPATVLADESPALCGAFKKSLLESPKGFTYRVELEGFPMVEIQWVPTCATAGVLLFKGFRQAERPDLAVLLLNGVETREDMAALANRFPLRADVWNEARSAPKPLAIAAALVSGRVREPATVTVLNAFANVFFAQFGTNMQ